tara:strand:+ start:808 stop:981 length:174 start_codon:yes stop_codon:yes gene_type:complete
MDGVLLTALLFSVTIPLMAFFIDVVKGAEGTKGITKTYTSPSGKTRTAKKIREDFIV